jgi:hypothetical protein
MRIVETLRNIHFYPKTDEQLEALRRDKWAKYIPTLPKSLEIQGQTFKFREGLTFTPFANAVFCNAHCLFCSEELQRNQNHTLTSKDLIKDYDRYFIGLEKAMISTSGLQMGLSLSGLEATAEPEWLLRLLDLIHKVAPFTQFDEKVLYTNGSGLFKYPHLISALQKTGFDRIELSRCHYNQTANQHIMYFNRNEPVWENQHYENLVKILHSSLFVKNSCILTQKGIKTIPDIETYLDWAMTLGVKEVVLRELSHIDQTYLKNTTAKWVTQNRVPIEPLLMAIAPTLSQTISGWKYLYSTVGYYYYNEHYLYQEDTEVILETSSYPALIEANQTGIIQKMVFHSNGNLCGDWDPNSNIIARFL